MNGEHWTKIAEVGTARALRIGSWIQRRVGRRAGLLLLRIAVAYFFVRNARLRRASRQYLERLHSIPAGRAALGRPPDARMVFRHIYEFAINLYDRTLVWSGAIDHMSLLHDGSGKLFELAGSGRGALLLGAHLGNFDMLWLVSRKYKLVVNVVAFFGNAERINALLEASDPSAGVRVIDLDPGSIGAALEIRSRIERGEFVVILADRLPPGSTSRVAEAALLGAPARFPLAPFLLPGALGCPVYFALCARRGDALYETILRPLARGERVARRDREKHAQELVQAYVSQLEQFCVELPYQWFNFYDFWEANR